MEARDVLLSVRALYANALGDAEIGCKQISETYWKMQRAIDKIDECHGCKCLSDKGHTLLDECIETLGRLAAVLQRAEDELLVTIGEKT